MKALVLTGGGAKGAWQAGVMKALHERGERYDMIVGTSVGAINGAGYSFGGVDRLISLWTGLRGRHSVMSFNWAWPWNWDGFYTFEPLRKILRAELVGDPMIPAYACRVRQSDGMIDHVSSSAPREEYISAIIGSSVVSGVQRPENGWIDGGHREVAPTGLAIALGAAQIDVIATDSENPTSFSHKSFFPILSNVSRGIELLVHEIYKNDVAHPAVNLYAPPEPLNHDPLDYCPKKLSRLIEEGYRFIK